MPIYLMMAIGLFAVAFGGFAVYTMLKLADKRGRSKAYSPPGDDWHYSVTSKMAGLCGRGEVMRSGIATLQCTSRYWPNPDSTWEAVFSKYQFVVVCDLPRGKFYLHFEMAFIDEGQIFADRLDELLTHEIDKCIAKIKLFTVLTEHEKLIIVKSLMEIML